MSLDSATDAVVAALRTLLKGGVNAETAADLGADAVVQTYGWPIAVDQVPAMTLPALNVWRYEEVNEAHTFGHVRTNATIRIDYYATPAGPLSVDNRWPLLRRVWDEITQLIRVGHHPSVSGDANLLSAAGVIEVPYSQMRVKYLMAPSGGQAFPLFQGQALFRHRTEIDVSALQDLVDLDATYNLKTDGADVAIDEEIITV